MRPGLPGAIHVRGGSTDQNLFVLDGAPVLSPLHAAGRGSALNPDVLAAALMHSGPAPARYGGKASAVIELESREPNLRRVDVQGALSSFHGSVSVQGPIVENRLGYVVGIRKGHGGVLATPIGEGASTSQFHDLFVKASLRLGPGAIRAFSFRSGDRLTLEADDDAPGDVAEPDAPDSYLRWSSATDAVSWSWGAPAGLGGRLVAWHASLRSAGPRLVGSGTLASQQASLGARAELLIPFGGGAVTGGIEHERIGVSYRASGDGESGLDTREVAHRAVVFTEVRGALTERLGATLGLRVGASGTETIDVAPRVQVTIEPTNRTRLALAYGRAHQGTQSFRNEESPLDVAFPIEVPGRLRTDDEQTRADLFLAMVRHVVLPGLAIEAQAFAKRTTGVAAVPLSTRATLLARTPGEAQSHARGAIVAAEGTWTSWRARVSYALSDTRFASGEHRYRPGIEHRHRAHASVQRRFGNEWTARAAAWLGSGGRTSPVEPGFQWEPDDPVLGEGRVSGSGRRVDPAVNTHALPPFFQLDLEVRGEWPKTFWRRHGFLGAFAGVRNITGHRNPLTFVSEPSLSPATPVLLSPLRIEVGMDFRF